MPLKPTKTSIDTSWLDVPLASLPLSPRAYRCLTAAGYQTLAEVASLSREELARLPGIGPTSLSEVCRLLKGRRMDHARALLASGVPMAKAAAAVGLHHTALYSRLHRAKKRQNNS